MSLGLIYATPVQLLAYESGKAKVSDDIPVRVVPKSIAMATKLLIFFFLFLFLAAADARTLSQLCCIFISRQYCPSGTRT